MASSSIGGLTASSWSLVQHGRPRPGWPRPALAASRPHPGWPRPALATSRPHPGWARPALTASRPHPGRPRPALAALVLPFNNRGRCDLFTISALFQLRSWLPANSPI